MKKVKREEKIDWFRLLLVLFSSIIIIFFLTRAFDRFCYERTLLKCMSYISVTYDPIIIEDDL